MVVVTGGTQVRGAEGAATQGNGEVAQAGDG
jgi:hypothetical protein